MFNYIENILSYRLILCISFKKLLKLEGFTKSAAVAA